MISKLWLLRYETSNEVCCISCTYLTFVGSYYTWFEEIVVIIQITLIIFDACMIYSNNIYTPVIVQHDVIS